MAQVVEHLPNKYKSLSSTSCTAKKEKEKEKEAFKSVIQSLITANQP
jgi:hypothetical protein